jgi:GNAT superfamily N-acetyltransferase
MGSAEDDQRMRIETAAWDDPDVQRLATAQQAELRQRYGGGQETGTPPSAADVGAVVLVRDEDGTPLGCGALRPLGGAAAELKRMFVVPAARGRGIGRAVLDALEAVARGRGWTTLRLETGPRQPEAVALYRRAGYRQIPAFGSYRGAYDAMDSLFFERLLDAPEPAGRVP